MYLRTLSTASLAIVMGLAPADPVRADAGDAIAGALVGGIIGHAIANDQNRRRAVQQPQYRYREPARKRAPAMSSAQREDNREVQTALNFFGYGVGSVDGVLGQRSRNAISQYQALLGYPPTGQLTQYERTILTTAYHRGMAGGPAVQQALASPQGMRGLLTMRRDEMAGIPTGSGAMAPAMMPAATPAAPSLPLVAGAAGAAAALPTLVAEPPAAPEPQAPQLPSFLGSNGTMASLASHCNSVGLKTSANGGFTTAATMTDARFALDEQFCHARSVAIADGEDMTRQVQGFTPQQVAEQCKAFGPALQEQVAAVSLAPRDDVLKQVSAFVLASGQSPAQLAGTARICLGSGYASDSMDVALGSALLLTALGQKGYAELLGHHLAQGFGASVRPDLALDWYQMGLDAVAVGGAVFDKGMPERSELIRKAAYTVGGRVDLLQPDPLPVFAATPAPAPAATPVTANVAGAGVRLPAMIPSR